MFGGKARPRAASGVRKRARKPKRAVGGVKTSTKQSKKKKKSGNRPKFKPKEKERLKKSHATTTASVEQKNPLFNTKKESDIEENYIYSTFIAGNGKQPKKYQPKRTNSTFSDKRQSLISDFQEKRKSQKLEKEKSSRQNSAVDLKRLSDSVNRLSCRLSNPNLDKELGLNAVDSSESGLDSLNFGLERNPEAVPEENEFGSIEDIKNLVFNMKKTQKSQFQVMKIPVAKSISHKVFSKPFELSKEERIDEDCYLDAYQRYLESSNENRDKTSVQKHTDRIDVSECSGCESLCLQSELVQEESNGAESELWYCKSCFQEMFGNASYKRALVFKKLRKQKGTQVQDAKLFSVQRKQNSLPVLAKSEHRKSSQTTDL